jgi:uncharacterized membrane protein YcaP (DUF421 family)
MSITELFIRILLSFLVLFVLTRIIGRKEISQMTFFNFASAITIGTLGGSLVTDNSLTIQNGVIALVGWSIFTIVMGYIDIKFKKARIVIEGEPEIVIKDGQIMENALRKSRLDIDALRVMLRKKEVFSLSDVEYAIFETDGKLSVMKKEKKQPVTRSDMNIYKTTKKIFPLATEVVSDGSINKKNLSKLNLDTEWLEQQLRQMGVNSISDIFYAEVQTDGTLFIDKKSDSIH